MVQDQPFSNLKPKQQEGAQSIRRALGMIQIVARYNPTGVTLSKVAREIELPCSTTHRILNAMVDEGMVCYNAMSKLYRLGIGLYLLGSQARQYELRDIYHSTLEKISEQTGDTAFLVIKTGYDVLCLDRVVGSTPIQVLSMDVGARRPLGVGAGSLAILAALPDVEVEQILRHNARRYASYSGYTPDDLQRMIQSYRNQGYIVNTVTPFTIGVGLALCDPAGKLLGAVSVSGILSKMDEEKQKETARLIQSEIRHTAS